MNITIVARKGQIFDQNPQKPVDALLRAGLLRGDPGEIAITKITRAAGDKRDLLDEIRQSAPDVLITEDLEGFEMCTLTDAVSYNLIHKRQFHFLLKDHIEDEKYLAKQLSLVMTFVCPDEKKVAEYLEKYPDLPEVAVIDI
ncbi:MAG: hypothetical protein K6E92_07435 [Lachnospiraceae bacterium]|nr:hypothetical protein [Lachnospiraceae bacterium]